MSSRITRTASVPIPVPGGGNSSSRVANLENIISIPFAATSPRPRARMPHASPTAGQSRIVRSFSGSYSSAMARSPIASINAAAPPPIFEPRIVRATDPTCAPAPTPSPASASVPARMRRPSAARTPSQTIPGTPLPLRVAAHQVSLPAGTTAAPAQTQTQTQSQAQTHHAFPRPAYLDHSALRELLCTDAAPLIATPSASAPTPASTSHPESRTGTPGTSYSLPRREHTPALDTDDESSPPPPSTRATPAPTTSAGTGLINLNPTLRLPTRWSEQDRHHALTVSNDGRDLTFYGPSCIGERDSAAARANYHIPPACGIYYYEVEILHKGTKGHISIGFSSGDVRLSRLPGWEKHSWGYHADDGWIFFGMKDGISYGPTFDTGDVIGCGIDFTQNRAFYTKNGSFLGLAFENVGKGLDIYPSIGLRHTTESVRANFGQAPFQFAIADHVDSRRSEVWATIQTTRIDWAILQGRMKEEEGEEPEQAPTPVVSRSSALEDEQTQAPIRKLVLSYLAHHGYARTARAFQTQCESINDAASSSGSAVHVKGEHDVDMDSSAAALRGNGLDTEYEHDLRARIDVVNSVLRGDIDSAVGQTQAHYPTVLEREQGLVLFKLRCRKFVELILSASEALKRVQAEEQRVEEDTRGDAGEGAGEPMEEDIVGAGPLDGAGAMDVDEPSPEALPISSDHEPSPSPASPQPAPAHTSTRDELAQAARDALHTAIHYGQRLEAEYKNDVRAEVRAHLKRTFGVVAYADPLAAGGEVAEMAGQGARARLASELNQAILESQGKPAHPALETLYRQTAACVIQLGLLGVGAAAFADMQKEFLDA